MNKQRKLAIAIEILKWQWRNLKTEEFMTMLKTASVEMEVPDDEMLEFLKFISDKM